MTLTGLAATSALAAGADSTVTPGVLGFTVVALLGVATFLLIRSMNRQIKRIDLPPPNSDPGSEPETDTDAEADRNNAQGRTPPDDPVNGVPDRP